MSSSHKNSGYYLLPLGYDFFHCVVFIKDCLPNLVRKELIGGIQFILIRKSLNKRCYRFNISLKNELDRETNMENKPRHVNRIAIKATPEQVWQAITDPNKTSKFWYNCSIRSNWEIGSSFELWNPEEKKLADGIILEMAPPHKLVMSWQFPAFPDTASESPSRITWEIESHSELNGVTLVSVVHDEIEKATNTAKILEMGLPIVLSGLKTLLETGSTLTSE
ncbi:SRPBCC domain-containing protein [Paenibacillus alginolyticus]|uniref:SRPBCC domain-containing protein n=2 Tax=Paenibacillus alginolyticus TaxID=59839 RepID=UPI002DB889FC|nr:SRPBCC domain-containing protein [Paenibacillus alginolyticus]MEC0146663.1 SRPBCC domain-containing protein [Paenibacillus alginolyticus]